MEIVVVMESFVISLLEEPQYFSFLSSWYPTYGGVMLSHHVLKRFFFNCRDFSTTEANIKLTFEVDL